MTRRVVAIVQARVGSVRLPSKVLRDLAGEPMLARVVSRTRRARLLDEVVVATTTETADDAIVALCRRLDVAVARGSVEDVLSRYRDAAVAHRADAIVRITSDCPLIDPEVIDHVVERFGAARVDYASNGLVPSYPRGLDTEVMTMESLERAFWEASELYERVHVTPYLYRHPDRFRLLGVTADEDLSALRWTVDTPEDLRLVSELYSRLGGHDRFGWREALALVRADPGLSSINGHVRQKQVEEL